MSKVGPKEAQMRALRERGADRGVLPHEKAAPEREVPKPTLADLEKLVEAASAPKAPRVKRPKVLAQPDEMPDGVVCPTCKGAGVVAEASLPAPSAEEKKSRRDYMRDYMRRRAEKLKKAKGGQP